MFADLAWDFGCFTSGNGTNPATCCGLHLVSSSPRAGADSRTARAEQGTRFILALYQWSIKEHKQQPSEAEISHSAAWNSAFPKYLSSLQSQDENAFCLSPAAFFFLAGESLHVPESNVTILMPSERLCSGSLCKREQQTGSIIVPIHQPTKCMDQHVN